MTLAETIRREERSGVEAARREEKLRRAEWLKEWRKLILDYVSVGWWRSNRAGEPITIAPEHRDASSVQVAETKPGVKGKPCRRNSRQHFGGKKNGNTR